MGQMGQGRRGGEEARIPQRGIECRWYAGGTGNNGVGRTHEVGMECRVEERIQEGSLTSKAFETVTWKPTIVSRVLKYRHTQILKKRLRAATL